MKWANDKPPINFWTLLFGSALGAAIATALGWFIQVARAFIGN